MSRNRKGNVAGNSSASRPGIIAFLASAPGLFSAGCTIILLLFFLRYISPAFDYQYERPRVPITWLTAGLMAAAGAYLLIALAMAPCPDEIDRITSRDDGAARPDEARTNEFTAQPFPPASSWTPAWVIGAGLIMRLLMFGSTPMLEDDYYRYLWDGAVLANGHNPYQSAPKAVIEALNGGPSVNEELLELAQESGQVIRRINYPELRTVYPPLAQVVFALAYWVQPWRLWGLRTVFLGIDIVTLALLALLLRDMNRPWTWLLFYWWNPILIKEIYNSCHMDVAILPFVLASLALYIRGRYAWSSFSLALAAGMKVWPVILFPFFNRVLIRRPRKLAVSTIAFLAPLVLFFALVSRSGLDAQSGFVAYSRYWEMNDALHMAILWIARAISGVHARPIARVATILLLAVIVLLLLRFAPRDPRDLVRNALLALAAMFLLSPTQFPWYYTWLLPFICLYPMSSLFLLTLFLPIYYLRFHFESIEQVPWFDNVIVWFEFAPVIILLAWEGRRAFSHRPDSNPNARTDHA